MLSFPELKREAEHKLVDFLKVELKLGFTFVDLAEQHHSEKHRARSLENARKAVETIHRFQGLRFRRKPMNWKNSLRVK